MRQKALCDRPTCYTLAIPLSTGSEPDTCSGRVLTPLEVMKARGMFLNKVDGLMGLDGERIFLVRP